MIKSGAITRTDLLLIQLLNQCSESGVELKEMIIANNHIYKGES